MSEAGGSFHNANPRTREERNAELNKDAFEKNRIRARQGTHFVPEVVPDNPVLPPGHSPAYASPTDRFYRDAAAAEKQRLAEERVRKQHVYENRRAAHDEREKSRWDRINGAEDQRNGFYQHNRDHALGARANLASEHFDIINLEYHPTPQGQMLKYKDDTTRYKAFLRSQNLYMHNRSVPHNIITGEVQPVPFNIPKAPVMPAFAQQQ